MRCLEAQAALAERTCIKTVICENAFMRTTVELPDDLFRRAKAHAALNGVNLKDLVATGLELALDTPGQGASPTTPSVREQAPQKTMPRQRSSAGTWAKRFAGLAKLA